MEDNPFLQDYTWFCANAGGDSQEVGGKISNGFGLYDMHGNILEWTVDWKGCSYPESTGAWCASGTKRMLRGGHWNNDPSIIRMSYRNNSNPTSTRYKFYGFRLRKLVLP